MADQHPTDHVGHFIWSEEFSVGVPELDSQHRKIISLINRLIDMQDAVVNSEVISETLNSMMRYTSEHLAYEEGLLDACQYPRLEAHRELHRAFLKKTTDLCMDTMRYKESVPTEVLRYLKAWWRQHILDEDRQYSTYLTRR